MQMEISYQKKQNLKTKMCLARKKMLYDGFFKEIFNPDVVPERLDMHFLDNEQPVIQQICYFVSINEYEENVGKSFLIKISRKCIISFSLSTVQRDFMTFPNIVFITANRGQIQD